MYLSTPNRNTLNFDSITELNMLYLTNLSNEELNTYCRDKPQPSFRHSKAEIVKFNTDITGFSETEYLEEAHQRASYTEHRAMLYNKSLGFPINVPALTLIYEQREAINDTLCARANELVPNAFIKNKYRTWHLNVKEFAKFFHISPEEVSSLLNSFKGDADLDILYTANSTLLTLTDNRASLPATIPADGYLKSGYRLWQQKTGRESPKPTEGCIMGMAPWLRHCVEPKEGMALLTFDWVGQESAIMAYLSQDPELIAGYKSGDIYAHVGKWLELIPQEGNKKTHPSERNKAKILQLSVSYGMGEKSINERTGDPTLYAKHKKAFKVFWKWVDELQAQGQQQRFLKTRDGWTYFIPDTAVAYKLANAKIQAEAAGLMRRALLTIPREIDVICPLHDAVYVNCKVEDIAETIQIVQDSMNKAVNQYFNNPDFPIFIETKTFTERYLDQRGTELFYEMLEIAYAAECNGRNGINKKLKSKGKNNYGIIKTENEVWQSNCGRTKGH